MKALLGLWQYECLSIIMMFFYWVFDGGRHHMPLLSCLNISSAFTHCWRMSVTGFSHHFNIKGYKYSFPSLVRNCHLTLTSAYINGVVNQKWQKPSKNKSITFSHQTTAAFSLPIHYFSPEAQFLSSEYTSKWTERKSSGPSFE